MTLEDITLVGGLSTSSGGALRSDKLAGLLATALAGEEPETIKIVISKQFLLQYHLEKVRSPRIAYNEASMTHLGVPVSDKTVPSSRYSSPMASLVLTDSLKLTSDSQHLGLPLLQGQSLSTTLALLQEYLRQTKPNWPTGMCAGGTSTPASDHSATEVDYSNEEEKMLLPAAVS
uniref:Uncharacterized protein n=1 Tax=Timema poppense TaxID=170557 RepID=A0A7R9DAQ4_TIMPO|nr:unnamed protein product [Timema poppensis]